MPLGLALGRHVVGLAARVVERLPARREAGGRGGRGGGLVGWRAWLVARRGGVVLLSVRMLADCGVGVHGSLHLAPPRVRVLAPSDRCYVLLLSAAGGMEREHEPHFAGGAQFLILERAPTVARPIPARIRLLRARAGALLKGFGMFLKGSGMDLVGLGVGLGRS